MSSSSSSSKFEKEKLKLIQEKCQSLLNEMLRDDDNKYCVDCDAKGPRWASWNLGVFLCIRCSGIHRSLGVHISRVKSVNLDTWTPEQVVSMQQMGNSRARAVYEATMPDNFRRPQTDVTLENFIRAKYEHKKYIAQEWVKPVIPPVNWDSEIEESLRKKKEAKKQGVSDSSIIGTLPSAIPKPKSVTTSSGVVKKIPSPASVAAQPSSSSSSSAAADTSATTGVNEVNGKTNKNPSDDLLGLMTHEDSSSNLGTLLTTDPFASPIKSTTTPNSNSAAHDLGSIFISSDSSTDNNGQKMTKESILSLYGQGSAPTGNSVNPFTSPPTMYSVPGAPPPLGNPFPQYASPPFNPNLMGHQGGGGGMNPYANHANSNLLHSGGTATDTTTAAGINNLFNFQTDVSQIQQQMYGIQLSFNNAQHNNALPNTGNNLGNYPQVGQTGTGIQSFLQPAANTASFQSPVGQSKNNPGPFF